MRQRLMGAVQDPDSPLGSPHPPLCPGAAQVTWHRWPPTPGFRSALGYGRTGRRGLRARDPDGASSNPPGGHQFFLPFLFPFILLNHKRTTAF